MYICITPTPPHCDHLVRGARIDMIHPLIAGACKLEGAQKPAELCKHARNTEKSRQCVCWKYNQFIGYLERQFSTCPRYKTPGAMPVCASSYLIERLNSRRGNGPVYLAAARGHRRWGPWCRDAAVGLPRNSHVPSRCMTKDFTWWRICVRVPKRRLVKAVNSFRANSYRPAVH